MIDRLANWFGIISLVIINLVIMPMLNTWIILMKEDKDD